MTPDEMRSIAKNMRSICSFCPEALDFKCHRRVCRKCHEMWYGRFGVQQSGVWCSDNIAGALNLLPDGPKLRRLMQREIPTEAARFQMIQAIVICLRDAGDIYRHMVIDRFSAFFLPQLADVLVAAKRGTSFRTFESFACVLFELTSSPYLAKFMVSKDHRAASAAKLAEAFGEQMLLYASKWEREASSKAPETIHEGLGHMRFSIAVLLRLMTHRIDEPGPGLSDELRDQLAALALRWRRFFEDPQDDMEKFVFHSFALLIGLLCDDLESQAIQLALMARVRGSRMVKCGWPHCLQDQDLYICSKCHVVLYCSREHQRAHWHANGLSDEAPHRLVCYKGLF